MECATHLDQGTRENTDEFNLLHTTTSLRLLYRPANRIVKKDGNEFEFHVSEAIKSLTGLFKKLEGMGRLKKG